MNWTLRELRPADQEFLWDMLYLALWDPPDQPRRPRSVLQNPMVSHYATDWGQDGDIGFVALTESGERAGAVWVRLRDPTPREGLGCDHPELGIAVMAEHHGKGAGSALMRALIEAVRPHAKGLRLGVHPQNEQALRLYEKNGFKQYAVGPGDYPQMKLDF